MTKKAEDAMRIEINEIKKSLASLTAGPYQPAKCPEDQSPEDFLLNTVHHTRESGDYVDTVFSVIAGDLEHDDGKPATALCVTGCSKNSEGNAIAIAHILSNVQFLLDVIDLQDKALAVSQVAINDLQESLAK